MNAQLVTGLQRWQVDTSHSHVGFAVRHMMVSTVRGTFGEVDGFIDFDQDDPSTAKIDIQIDAASIDTHDDTRDQHLRSADFFDAENYPKLVFVSRSVEPISGDRFRVIGDLTIRDITQEVVAEATFEGTHGDPWGGTRVGFSATAEINRHDYNLNWNQALEAGGVVVGEKVKINLELQAVHAPQS